MIYIAPEDISHIQLEVCKAIDMLGKGAKKVEFDVDIGDQLNPIKVSGYWIADLMRIDIKLKGQ